MEPIPRAVDVTKPAGHASALARMEARRLGHQYLGPEHLLVGLLAQGDNLAARVLVANGLDLDTVRAGIDRLVAQGVLPGPQPADEELLASLGVDLGAVHTRLQETFGEHAYWDTVQRVRHRAAQPVPHPPQVRTDPSPLVCPRAMGFAAWAAIDRDQDIGPEHLLLGLLREAEEPLGTELPVESRRERALLGLPVDGPQPLRRLVEAEGRTLEGLREALLEAMDGPADRPS
jgi:ATP-dependent Clp protease ATP-binding subunit ClpA